MAVVSREFWKPDEERQRAASAAQPVGSAPLDAGAAASNPVTSGGAAQVDPHGATGAIRSFFEANKDQGSKVLGGLADSINQKIGATQGSLEAVPTVGPQASLLSYSAPPPRRSDVNKDDNSDLEKQVNNHSVVDWANSQIGAYNQAQKNADTPANAETAARNVARVEPLAGDVNALGAGQEGLQSLLDQRHSGAGYTPGQSRLDAWLAGSAANANPGAVTGTQDAYRSLQANAAKTQNVGTAPGWTNRTMDQWKQLYSDEQKKNAASQSEKDRVDWLAYLNRMKGNPGRSERQ